MALQTPAHRYIAVLGPVKMEIQFISSISSNDTTTTLIQNPQQLLWGSDLTGGATAAPKCGSTPISGKTVTFTQTSLASGSAIALIFGF